MRPVPARRPSPAWLLLALVVLCAAPIAVAAATGLARPLHGADPVETAGGSPQGARDSAGSDGSTDGESAQDGDGGSSGATSSRRSPPPTGMADIPPTTPTTAAAAPPDTGAAPPPTEPVPPPPPPSTVAAPPTPPADQVVALVNQARAAAATPCPPLVVDPRLTASAQAHSDDMAARGYFSHTTPEGVTFDQRIIAAGYPQPGAENIAKGQRSAQNVMAAWMASAGHRANIENCRLTTIGVGLNAQAWTWTQNFGF